MDLYSNVENAAAFRRWLYMIHDERNMAQIGGGYGTSPIRNFVGVLTYRYLYLYCSHRDSNALLDSSITDSDILKCSIDDCFVDFFIRNENLTQDTLRYLSYNGVDVSESQRDHIASWPKTNQSTRRKSAKHYYDADTIELVRKRDKIIVDKFSYEAPRIE